jgi:hypothetical protein
MLLSGESHAAAFGVLTTSAPSALRAASFSYVVGLDNVMLRQ